MNQILTETTLLVKHVCNDLLPYILDELGIVGALSHVANRLASTTDVKVTFIEEEVDESIRFVRNEELALYRIIQELLNNIIKYAESTYIDIVISLSSEEFKIEIIDDGTGIIPNLDGHLHSFGLRNIVSRLQYVDATMVRTARRQRGTTVVIRKPLNEKENHNWRR
jgi:signal transduction histidine kinase